MSQAAITPTPRTHTHPVLHLLGLLLSGFAALLCFWAGMSIPSYFRSISPLVLEAAAVGTDGPELLARDQISRGEPGLALAFVEVMNDDQQAAAAELRSEADALIERHPQYRWSGGPAPFYEQFLKQAELLREDRPAVLPTLLPAANRARLLSFLEATSNQTVLRLLESREWSGWQAFYPVYTASGQPLDAAILAAALLEQSGAFPPPLRRALESDLAAADEGGSGALMRVEAVYAALLGLGRHASWNQLDALIRTAQTREDLLFMGDAVQGENADRWPLLLAAALMSDDTTRLRSYLQQHQENGWRALEVALPMGTGALQALLDYSKPLYHPPAFWDALPVQLRASQHFFKGLAEGMPRASLALRGFCFALCGFFLVGWLRGLLLGPQRRGAHSRMLWQLDRLIGASIVMILLWVAIEPGLLDFAPNEEGVIEIQLAKILPTADSSAPSKKDDQMIDQVTIIVLLLFLVLQLFVFVFGLLKLSEIRRQPVPASTKLRLLDNEENLFDLGLYVGLGGTVGSLILVVLNLVDASLMAAYASTLFGIIFVGALKVGYLRPFRRALILEATSTPEPESSQP